MDPDDLKEILFTCFESKEAFTFEELENATNQPKDFLKEILTHICNPIKGATRAKQYILKPEYRRLPDEIAKKQKTK